MRRVHAILGIVSSLNLANLLITGLLIQHREVLGLEQHTVSRFLLPASYRPDDGADGVRADIVVVDLHSGRLFGRAGLLILDIATLLWTGLLLSGISMFASQQFRRTRNRHERVRELHPGRTAHDVGIRDRGRS